MVVDTSVFLFYLIEHLPAGLYAGGLLIVRVRLKEVVHPVLLLFLKATVKLLLFFLFLK